MARKSKVLDNLSNVISNGYIINENEIENGNCEATEFIGDKTNEIPTGPELLKRVNINNTLVTFDALSTQKDTIDYIARNGGYYIAPVKGN